MAQRACVPCAAADRHEPLVLRRRASNIRLPPPTHGSTIRPQGACVRSSTAQRGVLLRRAEVSGNGVRRRCSGRFGHGRRRRGQLGRPPATALRSAEPCVGGEDGDGRGGGGRVLEQHVRAAGVEPAEPRPLARSRQLRGLVDAGDDLVADAPLAGRERGPRERRGGGGRRWSGRGGWSESRCRRGCRRRGWRRRRGRGGGWGCRGEGRWRRSRRGRRERRGSGARGGLHDADGRRGGVAGRERERQEGEGEERKRSHGAAVSGRGVAASVAQGRGRGSTGSPRTGDARHKRERLTTNGGRPPQAGEAHHERAHRHSSAVPRLSLRAQHLACHFERSREISRGASLPLPSVGEGRGEGWPPGLLTPAPFAVAAAARTLAGVGARRQDRRSASPAPARTT